MDPNIQKYLGTFRDATEDHLQKLNAGLLALEGAPGDEETIGEILREIHTLKGESRMMGFQDISEIAHKIEDVLKALRDQGFEKLKLVSDQIFDGFDHITALLQEKLGGAQGGVDWEAMCARLMAAAKLEGAAPTSPPVPEVSPEPQAEPAAATPEAPAAPPEPAAKTPSSPRAPEGRPEETVRIAVGKLDRTANITGDILLYHMRGEDRLREMQDLLQQLRRRTRTLHGVMGKVREVARSGNGLPPETLDQLALLQQELEQFHKRDRLLLKEGEDDHLRIGLFIAELRDQVMGMRMLPISTVFDFYPRIVRDLAKAYGKEVRLRVDGGGTEVDRRILDELKDPMVHLIRNAVDHGLEPPGERAAAGKPPEGTIRLLATQVGDHIVVQVADDGRGIDPERIADAAVTKGLLSREELALMGRDEIINLIFTSGFSSKETVTELSGRGVGMDVVRGNIEQLEGSIRVDSVPGRGTTFTLTLPLTLTLTRVLLVYVGRDVYALPSSTVDNLLKVAPRDILSIGTYKAINNNGKTVPLLDLGAVLEMPSGQAPANGRGKLPVVILSAGGNTVAFVVDRLVGEREVIIKKTGDFLGRIRNIAGATILGSGEVAFIVNVPQIIGATLGISSARGIRREIQAATTETRRRILVVDDSVIVRDMVQTILEGAGFEVETAVDGEEGLLKQSMGQYDLIMTDVEMPKMNGFELTEALKSGERSRDIPIIILTTLDSREHKEKGLAAGADAYLIKKDFDRGALLEVVGQFL